MSYDAANMQFEIYSESMPLIGFRSIEIESYFVDFPVAISTGPRELTLIEIKDPCDSPLSISAPV